MALLVPVLVAMIVGFGLFGIRIEAGIAARLDFFAGIRATVIVGIIIGLVMLVVYGIRAAVEIDAEQREAVRSITAERDEIIGRFEQDRPVIDVWATPYEVTDQRVILNVQNIGKSGAADIKVECWVGDDYYRDPAGFTMNPNDKERTVTCQRYPDAVIEPSPLPQPDWSCVVVSIEWKDANRLKTWKNDPTAAVYSWQTIVSKEKIWKQTNSLLHSSQSSH